MSVLKRFRSESKMQFYATAQKLRRDIMTLLLKDFGVRSKVRQLDIETRCRTARSRTTRHQACAMARVSSGAL